MIVSEVLQSDLWEYLDKFWVTWNFLMDRVVNLKREKTVKRLRGGDPDSSWCDDTRRMTIINFPHIHCSFVWDSGGQINWNIYWSNDAYTIQNIDWLIEHIILSSIFAKTIRLDNQLLLLLLYVQRDSGLDFQPDWYMKTWAICVTQTDNTKAEIVTN